MPDLYTSEHEDFRKTARTFFEREVVPHHDAVGAGRDRPARGVAQGGRGRPAVLRRPGGVRRPRGHDFRYNVILSEEQTRAGASGPGFSVHTDIIVPYLTGIASDEQKQRWLPGCVSGEIDHRHRDDRARRRQRPPGHPDHRGRQGRPLPPQRLEDVHLQRHQRRPRHRRRAHRPRGRPQGHQPAGRRARHGGLRARPQPRQDRPARPGHRRALVHRRRRTQGEPARRGGRRASST